MKKERINTETEYLVTVYSYGIEISDPIYVVCLSRKFSIQFFL